MIVAQCQEACAENRCRVASALLQVAGRMIVAMNPPSASQRDSAFSLTDLIVVLAVVLVLAALQLPSAAGTKGKGQSASCLYNHRQLVRAWQLYARDNGGRLVGNLDGGNGAMSLSNSNKSWVLGWLDFQGGQPFGANTNTLLLTASSPLAPYLGRSAAVFKCPVDTSLSLGRKGLPRVRSVSMNGYLGDKFNGRSAPDSGAYSAGYWQFKKLSEIVTPSPSQEFVFIDEREDSINDGVLQIDMGGFDPQRPSIYTIVDYPADWHDRGVNLSFVDGHTESWRWHDRRTMPPHRFGAPIPLAVPSPNNEDVARIQAAASRRVRLTP